MEDRFLPYENALLLELSPLLCAFRSLFMSFIHTLQFSSY